MFIAHGMHKYLKPQRGNMCSLPESQIRRIKRIARRRDPLYLAPEGRYVYSTRHAQISLEPVLKRKILPKS